MSKVYWVGYLVISSLLMFACSEPEQDTSETISPSNLFVEIPITQLGVSFSNNVKYTEELNVFNYSYFYNGAGVALGDVNNDGLIDIYFSANQNPNKLFINRGDWKFEDMTQKAGVEASIGWKTGTTMVDVNLDGWLDIYVCRSALKDSTLRKNLLFINNKDLTFTERGAEYGVDDDSYSSHAAFFDYDNDNDLDLFVLNHSLMNYANVFKVNEGMKRKDGGVFGSKLFQNQDGKFVNVTKKAGIISNLLSFGLGIGVSDLNQDGFMDMYVSNDFTEEDYLYINQGNGSFSNQEKSATHHVSYSSMGSDLADINNDGFTDIYTLDMLPASNRRIKLGLNNLITYEKVRLLAKLGFHNQYSRNMLQVSNGDGTFYEVGQLAGVSNTDWSWSPLFCDFDGDGWKDIYVGGGYEKDVSDMQFIKYTYEQEKIKAQTKGIRLTPEDLTRMLPSINEGSLFFGNNRNLTFSDKTKEWGIQSKFVSCGAAYADLDNDGDVDIVSSVINSPSVFYKNTSSDREQAKYVKIDLSKQNAGVNIIGTKIYAYTDSLVQFFEFSPVRGYESSMHTPVSIGLGSKALLDSIKIIWPDGKVSRASNIEADSLLAPKAAAAVTPEKKVIMSPKKFLTEFVPFLWKHEPAEVNDFKKQPIIPRMYSYTGPKMATGDVNGDKLEDIYVAAPKGQQGQLFIQQPSGTFRMSIQKSFEADKRHQDENAVFFDADKDGDLDLYAVSGGYMFNANSGTLQDRLYFNDGFGNFNESTGMIPDEKEAGSVAVPLDIDNDKDLDLFVGGRLVPGQYPLSPRSLVLINNGKGQFKDETQSVAPQLAQNGMITDAKSIDLNNDNWIDLVVMGEWMPIQVWINKNGKLINETSKWFPFSNNGWWNCLSAADYDNDGDFDIVAGNTGNNNQFKASVDHPVTLVYKDFNQDKIVDPFLCYFIGDTSYPFAGRDEALWQVNFLKPRFPDYLSYSNAKIDNIFKPLELKDTTLLIATEFNTVYFENTGSSFKKKNLPMQAQYSPVHAIESLDLNSDGFLDFVIGGNESWVHERLGRNSSSRGMAFVNNGHGNFSYISNARSGLNLSGDIRDLKTIQVKGKKTLLAGAVGMAIQGYKLQED